MSRSFVGFTTALLCFIQASAVELIVNGGFESGNSGFQSSYLNKAFANGNCYDPSVYVIGNNAKTCHPSWAAVGPKSGSNYMIVNGGTTVNVVWEQTVDVVDSTPLYLSAWVASTFASNPGAIGVFIDDVDVGAFAATSTTGDWVQFIYTWGTPAVGSHIIKFKNMRTATASGNDYGLDDISLSSDVPAGYAEYVPPATAAPSFYPTHSPIFVPAACINNFVVNGGFEQGNSGFTSGYSYVTSVSGNCYPEGVYTVGPSATSCHPSWTNFPANSGTQFMIVNGDTQAGKVVWEQSITVSALGPYNFYASVAALYNKNPASLQFTVDGISLGQPFGPPAVNAGDATPGVWYPFFATWQATSIGSHVVRLVNENILPNGNDFGLDDIVLCNIDTVAPSFAPSTASPVSDPTFEPTTAAPVADPTFEPTTSTPIADPTFEPTTAAPVADPTFEPTTSTPIADPTFEPTTAAPVADPTFEPTTSTPIADPTFNPTANPTLYVCDCSGGDSSTVGSASTGKSSNSRRLFSSEDSTSASAGSSASFFWGVDNFGAACHCYHPTSAPVAKPTSRPVVTPTLRPTNKPVVKPTKRPSRLMAATENHAAGLRGGVRE
jgi:hypothetical protein